MASRPEVHIGDVGTVYRVRLRDESGPVNPTTATTTSLLFLLSDGNTVTKTATVETDLPEYYLTYTVLADAGYNDGDFHPQAGTMKVQAYLAWADGSTYSSEIQTTDEDGIPLRVYGNLTATPAAADPSVPPDYFIQAGTGADQRTYQNKVRESFTVQDFGTVQDGSTSDQVAVQEALDAAAALATRRGLRLGIPRGIYALPSVLTLTRSMILEGEGGQSSGTYAGGAVTGNSTLLCAAAGILVDHVTYGAFSVIRDLEVRSSTASGNIGIRAPARAFIENVHVVGFGGRGIDFTASSASSQNANAWSVKSTRIEDCGGNGLHSSGTDSNAGTAIAVDAADNGGWGFYNDASHPSTYLGCQDEGNTLGGVKSNMGSLWLGHYNEGGQPANEVDEPDIIIGGRWFSAFASGMEPLIILQNKIQIGGVNPFWGDTLTATSSTVSRGFYANQGASIVTEVLAFAAIGRVAHGLTTYTDTATWFTVGQATASDGAALLRGYGDAVSALSLAGYGNGEATAEGASDLAHVILEGAKRSGTGKTASGATANIVAVQNGGSNVAFIKGDGTYAPRGGTYGTRVAPDHVLIGTSSITGMAAGFRADILTSTNEFLSFRGTGRIAHGVTGLADTTTLALWQVAGSSGGLQQLYFSASTTALDLRCIATGEDTTTSSAGVAPIMLDGRKANGTGTQAIGNTGNLLVLGNAGTGRILVKGNGDLVLLNGGITLPAANVTLDATTGTKFGTATSQKLAFYNATPIVQGASVADASGGATIDAEARTAINALISRIEALGLIATV